jgi:UDP-N-acetylmuramate--alanine ligase
MQGKLLKIFFSGIAGSGVSAIAGFMADKGHIVAGSDRAFDLDPGHPIRKRFQAGGITIVPQDGSGIDDSFDFAVFSTAVEPDRPEVIKARELGIPIKTRPDYLAEITSSFDTIAVSGTSGKSTASGMLAFMMERLGLSPNFIGGGRVKQFKTLSRPGNSLAGDSDYLVIEACESDGSIINYKPQHSIILNLAFDHHSVEKTSGMFETLMENTKGTIILNADDENLNKIAIRDAVAFSIYNRSDYKAEQIEYKPFSTDFTLKGTRFSLSLPGTYNLYNALSCIAFLSGIGKSVEEIAAVMPEFQGIDRRFDIYLNDGERLVVDDYAHNPHKISSLMETFSRIKTNVCYIFQPHGFGPTRLMKKEYIETFIKYLRETDHLILLPIYYAGGTAAKDISSNDLAEGIKTAGKSVEVVEKRADIPDRVNEYEAYVVFGARDETLADLAEEISGEAGKRGSGKVKE